MRNAELIAERLVVQSGSNRSGHRAADLALWHSSVVQMSASPRVIRPRAWMARLVTAQCALDCSLLEWRSGRRARARRHA